jgi:hypothetical protein
LWGRVARGGVEPPTFRFSGIRNGAAECRAPPPGALWGDFGWVVAHLYVEVRHHSVTMMRDGTIVAAAGIPVWGR